MKCIILAGGSPPAPKETIAKREAAEGESYLWGAKSKALLELEDLNYNRLRPIDRVIDAVKGAPSIDDWVVVGTKEVGEYLSNKHFAMQGETIGGNMRIGLEAISGKDFTLVLFSDLVMATPEIVDGLARRADVEIAFRRPRPAQLVSYVKKRTVGANFPRRYVPFWLNGEHTMAKEGNFLFITPETNLEIVDIIYSNRKLMDGKSQQGLLSYIVHACPSHLAAGIAEVLFTGGVWLSTFNDGFARLFGEKKQDGRYPNILIENRRRELQMDLDSDQDAARLGMTIVGNIEYKIQLDRKKLPFAKALKAIYEEGSEKVMLEPDAFNPWAYFLVVRWAEEVSFIDFEKKHKKDISELSAGMRHLGLYGR